MIKFVYCVRKRPELSTEQFRKYWLENHGPYVKSFAKALKAVRYVQSHTIDNAALNQAAQQPRGTAAPYDGITEVWWNSIEDLVSALQSPEGHQANLDLTKDEGTFCDLPRCSVFFTEEHTIF